jgi:hypothetical protein
MIAWPPLGLRDLRYRVEAALEYLSYGDVLTAEGVLVDLLRELNDHEPPEREEATT